VLKQWQFALLTGLALLLLLQVIANIVLFTRNREAQNEFATRAQYIQQTQQVEPLYQGIIRNLAEVSAKTGDPQISQLLKSQGITFTVTQAKGTEGAPKAAEQGKVK
jgi:hypothetical protein